MILLRILLVGDKPYLDGDRFTAGEEPLIPPKASLTLPRL
jgi:hypothetical protein